MSYRIVSAAGTVLAKGLLSAPDARRMLNHRRNLEITKSVQMPSTWRNAHIETSDGRIIIGVIPDANGTARYIDPALIRQAQRRGTVRSLVAIGVLALSAGAMVLVIWGAIVGSIFVFDAVVGQ